MRCGDRLELVAAEACVAMTGRREGQHALQALNLTEFDLAVLAAVAFNQPISRYGLKDIFGKEISRDLIGRLTGRDLIATGPREPRRGAPYTFVTTDTFLAVFGLETLRDLPDPEQLVDAGLSAASEVP